MIGGQNINLESEFIHQDNNESLPSCEVRAGFADFLVTTLVGQARQDLLDCIDTHCMGATEDCVYITGHS